ncbi:MAG: hypothetical protein OIF36_03790 [Alphaproteobacteria bacterium]|nr:hypothetical protein [Alphaproteobacteria bacterium]
MNKKILFLIVLLVASPALAGNSMKDADLILKSIDKYVMETKEHYASGGDFFGAPDLKNNKLSRLSVGSGCSDGDCELNLTSPDISNEICSYITKQRANKVIFCKNGHLDISIPNMK